MTARALVVPALLAAAALAATVDDASACSCVQGDPRTLLRQADAAFVGRLVEKRESRRPLRSSADPATYVFRVDRVVKGRLGGTVEVLAATSGASCGIEAERGKPVGLFLDRANGEWRSSLCQQIEPARLRAAARPLPAPNGRGPAALVVGGRFGPARTLALDAQGRTLAYGRGEGESLILSVCPGGRRVAELARREGSDAVAVAVRALPTLRTVWERRLATPAYTHATALSCRTPGGRRVLAFTGNVDFAARARLVRVGPASSSTLWRGTGIAASFGDRLAYVRGGRRGADLLVVDLSSGKVRRAGRVPPSTGALEPSPDRRSLAGVIYGVPVGGGAPRSRIAVVRLERGRVAGVSTAPLEASGIDGTVVWAGARLAFVPAGGTERVRVYDANLRPAGRFGGWRARAGVVRGGRLFGLGWSGTVVTAPLPRGPVRTLQALPSPVAHALASVSRA